MFLRDKLYEKHIAYDFKDKLRCNRAYALEFLRRTNQIFEYDGLPETIPKKYLELYLQYNGFACIKEHSGDLYAFFGGVGGEPSPYYQPTVVTISNPSLNYTDTCIIDKDCVLIRNDMFMQGLMPIIDRYVTAIVENDISLDMVSKNMRHLVFITAPTDDLQKAAKKVIDDINAGEQSIAADSKFLEGIKVFPLNSSHQNSITDLIEYHQYLKAGLFNELGLNSNYNMKREKLNDGETQLNQDALLPLIDEMLAERQEGIEKVNAMYGTNISVRLSPIWQENFDKQQDNSDESESKEGEENATDSTSDNPSE